MLKGCLLLAAFSLAALAQSSFHWDLPKPFPLPSVPADNPMTYAGGNIPEPPFRNTGLYNIAGAFSYPQPNTGLYRHTGRVEDVGKFRIPTLRNIAVTAPYMHDGSVQTLQDAIDHYAAGGRTIANGSNAGVGRDNRNKASNVQGFTLTPAEKKDLIAFLGSLTDQEFLNDSHFANPWK